MKIKQADYDELCDIACELNNLDIAYDFDGKEVNVLDLWERLNKVIENIE